jgi:hypothetical protein
LSIAGDDRKIAMLKRDPRCSRTSAADYADLGVEIVRRYVEAYDPGATPADYLLGGVVVRIEPTAIRAWDYADAAYV